VEVVGSNPTAPTIFFSWACRDINPESPTHNSTHSPVLTGSSPTPSPIPSGICLARPVFHHRRPGCRYRASFECVSAAVCSARSSVPPWPCSPTSGSGYASNCEGQSDARQAYGSLISVEGSPWLADIRKSHTDYCMSAQLQPRELKHLMILFDDGPCYEVICDIFELRE